MRKALGSNPSVSILQFWSRCSFVRLITDPRRDEGCAWLRLALLWPAFFGEANWLRASLGQLSRMTLRVMSISGLVVEYIVAIDVTRVRFPADALFECCLVPCASSLLVSRQPQRRIRLP